MQCQSIRPFFTICLYLFTFTFSVPYLGSGSVMTTISASLEYCLNISANRRCLGKESASTMDCFLFEEKDILVTSRRCFCLLQRAPVCLLPLPLELGLVDTGAVDQLVKLSLRRWRRLLGHPRNRCHVGVFDPGRGIPSMQGSGNRRPHLNLESMLAMFLVSMSI